MAHLTVIIDFFYTFPVYFSPIIFHIIILFTIAIDIALHSLIGRYI